MGGIKGETEPKLIHTLLNSESGSIFFQLAFIPLMASSLNTPDFYFFGEAGDGKMALALNFGTGPALGGMLGHLNSICISAL